jgi:protein-disulfide isomerase
LRTFISQGADINYLGRKFGLDGWLVSKGNNIQVVYTTLDGQGTLVGLLYGPNGDVVTGEQLIQAKAHGLNLPNTTLDFNNMQNATNIAGAVAGASADSNSPVSNPFAPAGSTAPAGESPSERIWKEMPSSTYLTFGSAKAPVVYVFMDPHCHYCHDYFLSLQSNFLPQNNIQLRVVPVGILGPDSEKDAEKILNAKDPASAWQKSENGDTSAFAQEGSPEAAAKLQQNLKLMGEWNIKGTPGTIYRGKDGKLKLVYGLPENIQQIVSDLAPS